METAEPLNATSHATLNIPFRKGEVESANLNFDIPTGAKRGGGICTFSSPQVELDASI
jgi:hypothetical protein